MANNRRFLAFVIALAMVLTMIPGAVFAVDYPEVSGVSIKSVSDVGVTESAIVPVTITYGSVLYAETSYTGNQSSDPAIYNWSYKIGYSGTDIVSASGIDKQWYRVGDYVGPEILGSIIRCEVYQGAGSSGSVAQTTATVTHQLTDDQLASVFTSSAAVYEYDGHPHTPVIDSFEITIGEPGHTTTYALSLGTHYTVAYTSGGSEAPSAAGTYTATVTFKNDKGLIGTTTAAFEISKREVTLTDFDVDIKIFNGTTEAALSNFMFGDEEIVSGDAINLTNIEAAFDSPEVGERTATIINAPGTWTVTGPAANNYMLANAGHKTTNAGIITKAALTTGAAVDGKIHFDVSDYNGIYDGNTHSITVTLPAIGGPHITYSKDGGQTYSADNPTFSAAGTHIVDYKITGAGFYDFTGTAKVNISNSTLTVTAIDHTITYGDAPTAGGITIAGFLNGDNESIIGGTLEYEFDYQQFGDVNVYTITPSGLTATNYAINYVAGKLIVTSKALGIEWGDTEFVYDGTAQVPHASPTGIENNDAVSFVVAGKATDAGVYVATATGLTGAKAGNYRMPEDNLTTGFAIDKAYAVYTVTPEAIENLVYDGNAHDLVTTGSATFGEIEYSTNGAVWSTTVPTGTNATTYAIFYRVDNDSKNNYIGISPASISDASIARKQATVSAIDAWKYIGTTDPALTATAIGLLGTDTVEYTVGRVTGEALRDYTITVSGDAIQGNYDVAYVPGTFTIKPNPSIITTEPAANVLEYNGEAQALVTTGSAAGGKIVYRVEGETNYSEDVPQRKDAGEYLVYYMVSPEDTFGPTDPKTVSVTISRKALTISAIDKTVTYGAAALPLEATASGLAGDDTIAVVPYVITRGGITDVGSETITVAGPATTTNYAVNYVNGTYTITTGQAVIVTAPAVKDLVYDGTSQELIIGGTSNFNTISYSTDGGVHYYDSIPAATNAGEYIIHYQVKETSNYYGVTATMAATIAPKPVTVTAITTAKAFGTSDPALTATVSGLIGADTVTYTAVRAAGEDAGEYVIEVTGDAIQNNYAVTYVNGKLTINKVDSEIDAPTSKAGLIYNGDDQDLVNPGTATGGTIQYSFNGTTFSAITPAGLTAQEYTIYYKVVGDKNHYDTDVASLTAIIAPKAATISAVNKTKEYGQEDPEFTATAAGLAGTDTIELFDLIFARTAGENVSTYAITVNISGAALNYNLTFEPGELEITKATLANADLTATPIAIALKGAAPDTGARAVDLTDIYNTVIAAGNEYQGTMAYTSNSGLLMISGTPVVDDKTLNITIGAIEPDKSGRILLTVTPIDSANYKTYTIEFALTTVGKTAKTEFDKNGVATSIAGIVCDNLQDAADNISGASVQVSMSISLVSEGGVSADLKDKVSQAAINNYGTNDEAKIGREYIDVSIGAVVDGNPINITDAGVVLEIVVNYDLAGKYSPVVGHRNPDGSAELFTELATKPAVGTYQDKTFYVDSTNNKIYIYSRYYSPFVILYAKAATHTITFNANGGTPATKTQTVVDNTATNLAANTFTRASYSFKGWNTAANGTGTAYADKASVTLTTAMALYAQWTYNGGGGGSGSGGGGGGGAATVKPTTTAAVTTSAVTYKNCTKDGKCAMAKFPDLVTNAWYHDGVHFVLDKGIMHGESNGKFEPDNETSRSMIAQILWNMEGNPVVNYAITYSDMTQYLWYTDAVRWTSAMNIMKGDSEGTFRGEDSLTREELAAVLYRFAQLKGQGFTGMWSFPLDYPDASKVDDWAYEAMCWMTMNGIIKGDEKGDLAPQATATRAEMATMIMRLCEYLGL